MTELERIIHEHCVPEEFLLPEQRCDFLVTANRKKLWLFQIDILKEIERICKKYNIQYFGFAGTLLGAIRHKGFIPWDDDIDIGMLRHDYDLFCRVAPKELHHRYFFQSPYTDEEYGLPHIKIRNIFTTGTTRYDLAFPYNQGICIDVFPIDFIPDQDDEYKKMCDEIKAKKRIMDIAVRRFFYIGDEIISEDEKKYCHEYISRYGLVHLAYEIERLSRKCSDETTSRCSWVGFHLDGGPYYPYDEYREFETVDFEFTTIQIQKRYHETLTAQYGDYKKLVKGGSNHGELVISFDVPYNEFNLERDNSII